MRFFLLTLSILFLFTSVPITATAQTIPVNRYHGNYLLLDKINDPSSFAFSLRKLTNRYTGYAIRLRRSTDNVQADISFDQNNTVSITSNASIAGPQSQLNGFTVGDVMTLGAFMQSATVYATIWYDQSDNHFDAVQTNQTKQPTFIVGSAGPGDTTYSSLSFLGTSSQALIVSQGMQTLLGGGIRGSLLLMAKVTSQMINDSFGYLSSYGGVNSNQRWSCQINWEDGNCYFDASENCCVQARAFYNGASLNLLKHYAFVRGNSYKTVRVNGGATTLNNTYVPSIPLSGGTFGIGMTSLSSTAGFTGKINEVILLPSDLPLSQLQFFESDQMAFWAAQ
jgi:hypothetical protein